MSWLQRHVPLGPALAVSNWRKIAIGTWRTAGDPSIYVPLELNAEPALAYLAALGARTNTRLTLSSFVGKGGGGGAAAPGHHWMTSHPIRCPIRVNTDAT